MTSSASVPVDTGTGTVIAEITDGVGVVTLNRPQRRNALHPEMYDGVPRALERFEQDDDVGCILVTGAGEGFCAGGDVALGAARRTDGPHLTREERLEHAVTDGGRTLAHQARMVVMLQESRKISIAALPGAAVGAGIGIALCTDLRIGAESARLIAGWGALGFSGDFGGTWFLARMIGPARTLEFLVGNETIGAARALELGLLNRVVPDAELAGAAMEWARAIASGPRVAYSFMKQNIAEAQRLPLADALLAESDRMTRSAQTGDHRRALKRWVEARRVR